MPLYLSSNPKLDKNLETLIDQLKDYLTLITGKDTSKTKAVAFALYYTLQTLPSDNDRIQKITYILKDKEKLEDEEFINDVVQSFKLKIRADIKNILKKSIGGESNAVHQD